jgi:hypothetical protein
MESSSSYLQRPRPLGVLLTFDVGQVSSLQQLSIAIRKYPIAGYGGNLGFIPQMTDQVSQSRDGKNSDAIHQGGFLGIHWGTYTTSKPCSLATETIGRIP